MKRICENCNNEFEPEKYKYPKTCSDKCSKEIRSKKMRGNNFGFKKGHKIGLGRKQSEATKKKIAISMEDPKRKELCRINQKKALKAIKEKSLKKFLDGNPTLKIGKRGYLMIYIPELADYKFKKDWRYYHHYVWESFNKKPLPKGYCIHHKDGNKLNNLIKNLKFMTIKKHDQVPKKTKKSKSI